ncbi:hypothetical protein MNBD_GAMMA25-1725 [hydrothermal vent metagenome]|uniref:DUF4124 domain-containing protein n=1 Tax=hydrothermal vent metagenome TaxID=652676 RepID=A0A3B1BIN7_9ZZZZ
MPRTALTLASLLLSFFILSSSQATSTYKWVNSAGNVVYSQHPPAESIKYEKIQTIAPSRSSSKSSSSGSSVSARESIMKDKAAREENEVVRQEMSKNEAERVENCKKARERLRFYQVQRRWKDKDGNIQSLEDDERMVKLDESKQDVRDFCN